MDIYWDNRAASKTVKVCNIGMFDRNTPERSARCTEEALNLEHIQYK